jgi:hypothetical protein
MIDIKMQYQASIFVNAADLSPKPDNITSLMDIFRDKALIPGTFQQISPPNPAVQTRLRLSSSNNEWAIMFGMRRIDIEKNPTDPKGGNLGDLAGFCAEVSDFFERLLTKFKKRANRLALITNFLLGEMTDERLEMVYRQLFKTPKFYTNNAPFEWNWRSASKSPIKIQELDDSLNVITIINRVRGQLILGLQLGDFDRLQLSFDINTAPENPEYRFDLSHIKSFYQKASEFHNTLCNEVLEYINE